MVRPDLLVLDEPTSGLDPLMEQAFRQCVHEARDRGQTVFLSSHIMSEVEALCDRVGILRDGKLVEMGTLAEMRHLSALTVEATFDGTVPDLSVVPGVSAVETDGSMVRCQVRGSIEPLVKALATAGVTRAVEPRALARRAVPRPVRGGRPCRLTSGSGRGCTAPVRAGGSPATVVAALSARKAGALGGPVGLHLRHRHRLVGDQLRARSTRQRRNATPWPPPTAPARR